MDYKGDIVYIEQVLSGKVNAFSYIVDRHKDKAYNLAFRICGNHEEAEEIAQDSFLKAFNSLRSFKMKSSFATWLYRIVYNTSISHVRIRKTRVLSIDDFPADATVFMAGNASEDEEDVEFRKSMLNFALQKITEKERGLITLYYFDELNTEEISEITMISKSNIKVKLFRARQKMSEIIENVEKSKLVYHE